ncbi:MAG: RAD55 family ATPase [Halobacteriaceae archaeon]
MDRIPFGISRLDRLVGGGAPPGSLVLLAGEPGAGAREFLYTSAVMNGLGRDDEELFDLHYGTLSTDATVPEAIHYVSFTGGRDALSREIGFMMDDEVADGGLGAMEFRDLSPEYFQLSPVPREWYTGSRRSINELGAENRRDDIVEALADYLEDNAADSLVCVDSLTDLIAVSEGETLEWPDIVYLLKGLRRAVHSWGGLLLVHVSMEALSETDLADLMASADGTMVFEWERGGNELARTMVVREFRGVLPQIEAEDIARFETEIHDAGFDISDVRKIR